mgnify:CR=1 FL=1|jgi:hypothetical protein
MINFSPRPSPDLTGWAIQLCLIYIQKTVIQMAETCIVCNTKIAFFDSPFPVELETGETKDIHYGCRNRYFNNPEEFGGPLSAQSATVTSSPTHNLYKATKPSFGGPLPAQSATSGARDNKSNSIKVVVTDIQMPFESMVIFMVKWAFASIPAMIILGVVWMLLLGLFS